MPFDPVPVTSQEKCFAATGDRNPDACGEPNIARFMSAVPWPEHIPPFVMARWDRTTPGGIALQPGPNGLLLIQRTRMADAPGKNYDVVDRTGSLRGTLRLPEDQTVVGWGSSSLYVVTKDDVDLLTLSRHAWPF